MANVKISELTALTPPDAADLVPVTDSSASQTKRTTVGEIVGIINGDVDVANDGTATISELPVSKLQDGDARQLLQTDAAGTGVEWTSNVDVPGTLDVTGQSTLASAAVSDLTSGRVVLAGTSGELEDSAGLTFNGTQLDVDGDVDIANAKEYRIAGTKVLDATSLGSAVVNSSLTSVGTISSGTWQGTAINGTYIVPNFGSQDLQTTGSALIGASSSILPYQLQVIQDSGANVAFFAGNNTPASGGYFVIARSRGTTASPSVVANGDTVGVIEFRGYSQAASAYRACAQVKVEIDGEPDTASDATDMPARLVFTTSNDGSSSPTEKASITPDGKLLVGTSTDAGGADIQAVTSMSIGGLVKREYSKELSLTDNTEETYLTFSVPGGTSFTHSANIGAEITYAITCNRLTSGRDSGTVYGKVYVAIDRHWESNSDNPVRVNIASSDQSLVATGSSPTITWSASTEAGIDNAAKEVYIKVQVDNPHSDSNLTVITGTVAYHTRATGLSSIAVS